MTINPQNACKLEFDGHLWLPFLDQPQSEVVVFIIITFQIYKIIVTKYKNEIFLNGVITFNEKIDFFNINFITS